MDGQWITYQRLDGANYHIYKIDASGGSEILLTSGNTDHEYPQWSPDGQWLVYQRLDGADYQIYKVDSGGSAEIALTSGGGDHEYPQWSPNGLEIVYQRYVSNRYQVFKVQSNGGTETQLTSDNYNHEYPQWSPDGSEIVYQKNDGSNYQIYKIANTGISEIDPMSGRGCAFTVTPTICTEKSFTIEFALPSDAFIELVVYDASGRVVGELGRFFMPAGNHRISFGKTDRIWRDMWSGCYFIKLRTGTFSETRKIIILR